MGGVDLVDHRTAAYHLYHKSSIRFYLPIFELINVPCVKVFIIYNMMYQNDLNLLDRLNPFDWSVHKLQQSTTRKQNQIKEKMSLPIWV